MKKLTTLSAVLLLLLFSCQKTDQTPGVDEETPEISSRTCASHEVFEQQLASDPGRRQRMQELEEFTNRYIQNLDLSTNRRASVTIPVVVHVVYNKAAENITQAQVESQIAVLNEDFNSQNDDVVLTPSDFSGVVGTVGVTFQLQEIKWVKTKKSSFSTNDAIKFTSQGGSDAVDPANTLNIWCGNLGRRLLGYAQFPTGPLATDGVVVHYLAFGSDKIYSAGNYYSSYNLGRTATHEVGHYLNLRHIWGDATCGNDFVGDTPLHNSSNGGCPTYPHYSTCSGNPVEMTMNYMDYTYDACMYMFSQGQSSRMNATFAVGGPRYTLVN